ncbi:MAG: LytTR family transcriptional regulator [Bacteroidales bacterium]|nr:LytTR family transcriptional regulator [Candidatus Cacconaster merdequi]
MSRFPDIFLRYKTQVLFYLALPLFFFGWVLIYNSESIVSLLREGPSPDSINLNLPIVTAIIFVVSALSRSLLYILRSRIVLTAFRYFLWCLAEVVVISLFVALYLTLRSRSDLVFFDFLPRTLLQFCLILVYPYIILSLIFYIIGIQEVREIDQGSRVRFYDSRHLLKFITTVSSILYVESKENYVIIHYVENGLLKHYQLRNTMKNVEELLSRSGFVRTHRSFCVNPSHIAMLRKEKNGLFFAELDSGAKESIPVSKKYYEALTSLL